jgi:hypothetical protein
VRTVHQLKRFRGFNIRVGILERECTDEGSLIVASFSFKVVARATGGWPLLGASMQIIAGNSKSLSASWRLVCGLREILLSEWFVHAVSCDTKTGLEMDDCTAEMLSRCGRAKGVTSVKTALSEEVGR